MIEFSTIHKKSCPICASLQSKFLGMRGGKFQREGLGIESNIFQCLNCYLVYPNPFPIPKTLESLYGDTHDYFSKKESWEVRAKMYESLIKEFINRLGDNKKEIKLLDIGAGRGEFCQAALSFPGVNCTGTEVSLGSIQYAQKRGIKRHNKSLQDLIEEGKVYDGICLNAVLAHVHEPAKFIEEASQLLRKGGLIYIDTPNEPNLFTAIGNFYNKITGSKAVLNLNPTWQPYAVYGFNSKALRALLDMNKIKIVDITIHGNPTIPLAGGLRDKLLAKIGSLIQKIANLLSLGTNMYVWGKKL